MEYKLFTIYTLHTVPAGSTTSTKQVGKNGEYPGSKIVLQTFLTACLPRPLLVHYEQTTYSRNLNIVLYTLNLTNVTVLKYCNSYIFLSKRYF